MRVKRGYLDNHAVAVKVEREKGRRRGLTQASKELAVLREVWNACDAVEWFVSRFPQVHWSECKPRRVVLEYAALGTLKTNPEMGHPGRLACVADALSFMHSLSLAFCDLKPANVLVFGDGALKLSDFGACRTVPHAHRVRDFWPEMSPQYAAPELCADHPWGVEVDLWAFGALCTLCALQEDDLFTLRGDQSAFYRGDGDEEAQLMLIASCCGGLPERFVANAAKRLRCANACAFAANTPLDIREECGGGRLGEVAARTLAIDPDERASARVCANALGLHDAGEPTVQPESPEEV